MGFGSGHRLVFDAPRNNEELAFVELDDSITKVDGQVAAENQEELVLMLVVMPDELTFDLRELYLLAVELSDDPRAPAFRELLEFLGEVHLLDSTVCHARLPSM